jgi:hypothetical protein
VLKHKGRRICNDADLVAAINVGCSEITLDVFE